MTNTNAADLLDLITGAMEACEHQGISFGAADGAELLQGIDDHRQAFAELAELARLIDAYGGVLAKEAA